MSETWYGIVPSHWTSVRFKDFLNLVIERSTSLTKVGLENIESGSGRFIHTDSVFEGNGIALKKMICYMVNYVHIYKRYMMQSLMGMQWEIFLFSAVLKTHIMFLLNTFYCQTILHQ